MISQISYEKVWIYFRQTQIFEVIDFIDEKDHVEWTEKNLFVYIRFSSFSL